MPNFTNYIDVAFPTDGCKLRDEKFGASAPIFDEVVPVIPQGEWKGLIQEYDLGLDDDVAKIKNQRNEGSCTANAGTQGWECIHNHQFGKDCWVELSAISLYKRTGRSPNSGSTVSGNVRELRDVGALPTHAMKSKLEAAGLNPAHTMPEIGFYTAFPSGWKETAKHFRIEEYYDIRNIEGFFSALLMGYVVHYGRAGHSILAVKAVLKNGQVHAKYANSWGNWGDGGFGYDSIGYIRNAINSYGAYAYRSVSTDYVDLIVPEYSVVA